MAFAGLSVQQANRSKQKQFERRILCHAGELLEAGLRFSRNLSLAENLVQQTMLRAWCELDRVEKDNNCRVWLFRTMLSVWNHDASAISSVACGRSQQEQKAGSSRSLQPRAKEDVRDAVDHLREDLRVLLLLFSVDEFSCAEISEILTTPIHTVISNLAFARQLVKSNLGAQPVLRVAR